MPLRFLSRLPYYEKTKPPIPRCFAPSRHASGSTTPSSSSGTEPSGDSKMTPDQRFQQRREEESRIRGKAIERLQNRVWKNGDQYSPHDLSATEQQKWGRLQRPKIDAFDVLSINPLEQYANFSMMSEYMTDMGRIRPASETGLRRVNQRKIAKAIRRSIGIGLMPSVYHHPEILVKRWKAAMARVS